MRSWRRLFYFLLLNILISAVTTWTVVTIMLRNYSPQTEQAAPTLVRQTDRADGELVVTLPAAPSDDQPDEDLEVVSDLLEIESVIGTGELDTERVIIQHIGDKEVSLLGWELQDQDGQVFSFPALTIFSGGAVTVFTRQGTSTVVELYWGLDEAIWQPGEKAFLLDPQGDIQAVYTIP
jgi:hypothetical protein